ncbi:MAG: transglycosylase domain-containing protein [Bacteroidia bacterium]|nr:transglycosylase domain-containing protein [Bacteroidia bacterium]
MSDNNIKKDQAQPKKIRKYIICLWSIFGFGVLSMILFFALLSYGYLGFMPSFEDLENPKSALATDIISEDGVTLGKFYVENRSQVDYEDISEHLIHALVATEDERFYDHSGVDARGLARVLFKTVIMQQKNSGGGSTITQQLAKMLFHGHAQNKWERYTQKLKEWVIAVKLERSYTKEEILAMYLNRAAFIYDAYGIESASWTFFNTSVGNLRREQAAVLVGMLKNPSLYNPIRRPELVTERRNTVLYQMLRSRYINKMEYDSLKTLPLGIEFKRSDHKEGVAPYFREWVRLTLTAEEPKREAYPQWNMQKFIEDSVQWATNPAYGWIKKNPKADGSYYNIYKDGLKIHTTIDSRLQKYAEQAMYEHLGGELQPKFFESKGVNGEYDPAKVSGRAPFSKDVTADQYKDILKRAMKNSDRYRTLKKAGASEVEIEKNMHTPTEMKVFDWKGEKDVVWSPADSILYHKFFIRSGMMSVDPRNGHIKVYVGGPDFKYFQYDMVSQGKRQVGSTIKPFFYAKAMLEGRTPCDLAPNMPQTFQVMDPEGNWTTWTPRNAGDARLGEMVSLKWGLANSNNNITAWLMKQFSPQAIVQMAHDLGISSYLDPVYSLCLGTSDVSLFEMVEAYATFVNKGVHMEPIGITSIEDKYGNEIAKFVSDEREVMSEESAYMMVNLLEGVINQGTGRRLRGPAYQLRNKMGGKTGTTQNHSDGWFMSILPNLVSGVWVGGEDRSIHFDSMRLGQAANMAIPIFGRFILKVFDNEGLTRPTDKTNYTISPEDVFIAPPTISYSLDCADRNLDADEGNTEAMEMVDSEAEMGAEDGGSVFDI